MAETGKCSQCGAELPADAPGGLCPRCVLASALEAGGPAGTIRLGPLPEVAASEKAGDWIGRYKLVEQIGEGGMGSVWMAEQQEPVRRRVALKVIKLGMDTKQVMARFEAERQALALMDHPNIAQVLDAGATETGRPYFVMELVQGIAITDYCDQNHLSTRGAARPVHPGLPGHPARAPEGDHPPGHQALQHPGDACSDGAPVPKVIDFGIAKATEQQLTDKTLFTALGAIHRHARLHESGAGRDERAGC